MSQLELLYAELTREEQQKQLRKEQKKLKRKRKKERMAEQGICNDYEDGEDFDEKEVPDGGCSCTLKIEKSVDDTTSTIFDGDVTVIENGDKGLCIDETNDGCTKSPGVSKLNCGGSEVTVVCRCHRDLNNFKNGGCKKNLYRCDKYVAECGNRNKENGSSSDHSHDCGYSSENNNGCCETASLSSSLLSTPEGSEVACSDSCCQPEYAPYNVFSHGDGHQLSLQEMLDVSEIERKVLQDIFTCFDFYITLLVYLLIQ